MAKKSRKKRVKRSRAGVKKRSKTAQKAIKRAPRARRYDPRLEFGLQYLRKGDSLAEAARKIGVTPVLLRRYAISTGIVTRRDGKWHFKRDRRFRRMPFYSDGRRVIATVHNGKTASLIGSYMRAVRLFFDTESIELLTPYQDRSVRDIDGKRYVFETRPNYLLRLDASSVEPFELAYEIVKRG